jgi:hypothetical protein
LDDNKSISHSPPPTMPRGRGRGSQSSQNQPPASRPQQGPTIVNTGPVPVNQVRVAPAAAPQSDPVTPINRTFQFIPYQPPPLAARPIRGTSDDEDGEEFDFGEVEAMPKFPATAVMESPVKRARVTRRNQESLNQKGDLEVWDESDEEIISLLLFLIFIIN